MNICKVYSRHSSHTVLKTINFWCWSHSTLLRRNGPTFATFIRIIS